MRRHRLIEQRLQRVASLRGEFGKLHAQLIAMRFMVNLLKPRHGSGDRHRLVAAWQHDHALEPRADRIQQIAVEAEAVNTEVDRDRPLQVRGSRGFTARTHGPERHIECDRIPQYFAALATGWKWG